MADTSTEGRLATLEANEKTIFKKLDEQGSQIKDLTRLTVAVEKIAVKTDSISEKVDGIDERMTAVESGPAKKWEKAKETIWIAVVTGVVGAVLGALIALLFK